MMPRDVGPADLPPRPRQQDREWGGPRDSWANRSQDRLNDQPPQVPTAPSGPADASDPPMNPQRAALFAQDDADRTRRGPEPDRGARSRRPGPQDSLESLNPERAALIDDRDDVNPHGRVRDDGRERGPRTQSPRRGGRPPSGPYDDRHAHAFQQDNRQAGRNARERSPHVGENYRGNKGMDRDGERAHMDKMRDASSSGFHRSSLGQEVDHRPPYQDQNYGRLNPVLTSTPDIPLGPRGRGRGASRNNQQGGPPVMSNRPDNRYGAAPETPRAPSQERHPPSGPASGRGRRGGYEHTTGPSTPSAAPVGPHPDRMRNFGGAQENPPPPAQGSNATAASGVHPDRLAQMGGSSLPNAPPPPPPPPGPPPYGHGHGHNRHSMSSSGNPERSGPRTSTGSLPESNVPTGPASSGGDRQSRSGGGRRQLAGINNMLQQAQAAMPNEGRPSGPRANPPRQMLGHSDVQVLAGGDVMPPTPDRVDAQWHESPARSGPLNGEDGTGRGEHERRRRDGDSRNERSKRSSRRSSREREREGKEHSEHRERRSMGGVETSGTTREDRDARRSTRDGSSRDAAAAAAAAAAPSSGRESRHRGDGSMGGTRGGDDRSGNRANRGNVRDGTQRTDEQRREHRDDRGRKRRGEEADGALSSDREKRPRR